MHIAEVRFVDNDGERWSDLYISRELAEKNLIEDGFKQVGESFKIVFESGLGVIAEIEEFEVIEK